MTEVQLSFFRDVLGDIADSYMNDPGQRRALISDVMESLVDILAHPEQAELVADRRTR